MGVHPDVPPCKKHKKVGYTMYTLKFFQDHTLAHPRQLLGHTQEELLKTFTQVSCVGTSSVMIAQDEHTFYGIECIDYKQWYLVQYLRVDDDILYQIDRVYIPHTQEELLKNRYRIFMPAAGYERLMQVAQAAITQDDNTRQILSIPLMLQYGTGDRPDVIVQDITYEGIDAQVRGIIQEKVAAAQGLISTCLTDVTIYVSLSSTGVTQDLSPIDEDNVRGLWQISQQWQDNNSELYTQVLHKGTLAAMTQEFLYLVSCAITRS